MSRKKSLGLLDTNVSPNSDQKMRTRNDNPDGRNCCLGDVADERVKIKESERIIKYLNLSRQQNMLWNMKVTVITIVV